MTNNQHPKDNNTTNHDMNPTSPQGKPEIPDIIDLEILNGHKPLAESSAERLLPGDLDQEFFSQTSTLNHIYRAAAELKANPTAVLYELLAVVASRIPHTVRIQHNPLQKARMSPNLFVCLVGASGSGKGLAQGVANDLLPLDTYRATHPTSRLVNQHQAKASLRCSSNKPPRPWTNQATRTATTTLWPALVKDQN